MEGGPHISSRTLARFHAECERILNNAMNAPTQDNEFAQEQSPIDTFHFQSELDANSAIPLVFRFCEEQEYEYGHRCCRGKGHVIRKNKLLG